MLKDQNTLDLYSAIPFVIEYRFNDLNLGHATGFFYQHQDKIYLVTNWHVFSGRHALTREPLNKNACIPNNLIIHPMFHDEDKDTSTYRRKAVGIKINLCREDGSYIWLEHPTLANKVDVAVIEVTPKSNEIFVTVNKTFKENREYETYAAQDVFILGYPLDPFIMQGLPIWKRGTISNSTMIDVSGVPKYLIDTATRNGMSGSPVFASFLNVIGRTPDGKIITTLTSESTLSVMPTFEFLGVYSSRLGNPNENDTLQLGNVWKTSVISEIISGNKYYSEETAEAATEIDINNLPA